MDIGKALDQLNDVRKALARLAAIEELIKRQDEAMLRLDDRLREVEVGLRLVEERTVHAASQTAIKEARELMEPANNATLSQVISMSEQLAELRAEMRQNKLDNLIEEIDTRPQGRKLP